MVYTCSTDSFKRTLEAKVLAVEPSEQNLAITLSDSNDVQLLRLIKSDAGLKHIVPGDSVFGETVVLRLDWDFRFSNMQQHSGQHLISAIAESTFGFKTVGWSIGIETSAGYIDFEYFDPAKELELEDLVNEAILENLPVTVTFKAENEGKNRTVTISGFKDNMCCGTHVNSTGQIQTVKFYGTEKKGGKGRLYFRAGKKALKEWQASRSCLSEICKSFSCSELEISSILSKLKDNLKTSDKENAAFASKVTEALASCVSLTEATCIEFEKEPNSSFCKVWNHSRTSSPLSLVLHHAPDSSSFWLTGTEKNSVAEILKVKNANRDILQGKIPKASLPSALLAISQLFPNLRRL